MLDLNVKIGQKIKIFQKLKTKIINKKNKNFYILKAVNYFCKKVPSLMFDWVLNTPLVYLSEL